MYPKIFTANILICYKDIIKHQNQFIWANLISSHTLLSMWLLIHPGIKVNPVVFFPMYVQHDNMTWFCPLLLSMFSQAYDTSTCILVDNKLILNWFGLWAIIFSEQRFKDVKAYITIHHIVISNVCSTVVFSLATKKTSKPSITAPLWGKSNSKVRNAENIFTCHKVITSKNVILPCFRDINLDQTFIIMFAQSSI